MLLLVPTTAITNFSGTPTSGSNFARNVTSGSYSGHSGAGGFSGGGATGYGANKPQYNGQDDLLGDDYFDSKEASEDR